MQDIWGGLFTGPNRSVNTKNWNLTTYFNSRRKYTKPTRQLAKLGCPPWLPALTGVQCLWSWAHLCVRPHRPYTFRAGRSHIGELCHCGATWHCGGTHSQATICFGAPSPLNLKIIKVTLYPTCRHVPHHVPHVTGRDSEAGTVINNYWRGTR